MVMVKHYCGGELMELAFFQQLDSCCDGMEKSGCCETEHQDLKHDDNTPISVYSFEAQVPVLMYVFEFPSLSEIAISNNSIIKAFMQTPITVSDILIRIQLFLL